MTKTALAMRLAIRAMPGRKAPTNFFKSARSEAKRMAMNQSHGFEMGEIQKVVKQMPPKPQVKKMRDVFTEDSLLLLLTKFEASLKTRLQEREEFDLTVRIKFLRNLLAYFKGKK